jgi:transcriptional antiterminator NusG
MLENIEKLSNEELWDSGVWYTLQVHFNNELAARANIITMLTEHGIIDKVKALVVPTEKVVYINKSGENIVDKALIQGYLFLCFDGEIDTTSQMLIKQTSKVSTIVSYGNEPVKLTKEDLFNILNKNKTKTEPRLYNNFEIDEQVKIEEGPFENFNGVVEEFTPLTGMLKLNVKIFGRDTPVEIHYSNVSKMD